MFSHKDGVLVHHVKQETGLMQQEALLKELASKSDTDRVRLVLNCSDIRNLDRNVTMLLVSCLEAAMMGNGDVRLAGVSTALEAKLWLMGLTDIFEMHSTAEAAVQSFRRRRFSVAGMQNQTSLSVRTKVAA